MTFTAQFILTVKYGILYLSVSDSGVPWRYNTNHYINTKH